MKRNQKKLMTSMLKSKLLKVFIFANTIVILGYFISKNFWQISELSGLAKDIDRQVELTKNGIDGHVFFNTENNSIIILSPPYADLQDIDYEIAPELIRKMQTKVDSFETGHLFLIQKNKIIDHHLLSYSASAILAKDKGKKFLFLVSKNETSGRSIRIEMKKLD